MFNRNISITALVLAAWLAVSPYSSGADAPPGASKENLQSESKEPKVERKDLKSTRKERQAERKEKRRERRDIKDSAE